jgi:hypothetical protein
MQQVSAHRTQGVRIASAWLIALTSCPALCPAPMIVKSTLPLISREAREDAELTRQSRRAGILAMNRMLYSVHNEFSASIACSRNSAPSQQE